jgi:hypothetical protein
MPAIASLIPFTVPGFSVYALLDAYFGIVWSFSHVINNRGLFLL